MSIDQESKVHAYALGQLNEAEAQMLESQARSDASLAAEIALAKGLVAAGAQEDHDVDDLSWRRLKKTLEAESTSKPEYDSEPFEQDTGLSAVIRRPRFAAWQVAAMVAASIAVWQIGAAPLLGGPGREEVFVQASEQQVDARSIAKVAFNPEATESNIRQALRSVDAEIVAGPTALGFYNIAFADELARENAIAALLADTSIVEHAEVQ